MDGLDDETRAKTIWLYLACMAMHRLHEAGELKLTETGVRQHRQRLEQMVADQELARHFLGRRIRASERLPLRQLPCGRTLLNHLRTLRNSGFDPMTLAPRKTGSGWISGYFSHDVEALLQDCVLTYANVNRPTMEEVIEQTRLRFKEENTNRAAANLKPLHTPSPATIRRRINALDPFETDCARFGLDATRKKYAMWSGGLDVQFPMERIEVDEWQVDLITYFTIVGLYQIMTDEQRRALPKGRRWIYAAIDCASRCILGLLIVENPSAEAAVQLLNMIVTDKSDLARALGAQSPWNQHGGISSVACDTGTAFFADAFVAAVNGLGGIMQFAPVKIPELRGRIERPFGTLTTGLMPRLSGRTFSNPLERGDYDSEGNAALDDDDLARILTYFIVDYYHNKPHGGLGGQTPANRWKELVRDRGISAPPDRHVRRTVLGHEFERILSKRGIRFFGNFYSCPELREKFKRSRNRKFTIRIDPEDIGEISIRIGNEWHSASPVKGNFDGISLADWIAENRVLLQRYASEAELTEDVRDRAIANIRAIDKAARLRAGITPQNAGKTQLAQIERSLFQAQQLPDEPAPATASQREAPFGRFIEPAPSRKRKAYETRGHTSLPQSDSWSLEDE
ncbi:Mu transposase C-terminal domain-containing protein [Celeribacter naphthalenivorans]|uniref:Mu transposase C-terminal domain-containing protein n=1 Tax=Celeribacter naphthalenivorans TaxID=1614694 RepID=UPI001CFC0116|nr:Mu transposase C-terminal domain-containing protein [Celeribacter naphthalenivorans]